MPVWWRNGAQLRGDRLNTQCSAISWGRTLPNRAHMPKATIAQVDLAFVACVDEADTCASPGEYKSTTHVYARATSIREH